MRTEAAVIIVLVLVLVGVVTAVIVAGLTPVRCARCPDRPRMRPVDGAALDALLSPTDQTERRIGATRFMLRACPACRTTGLERRPVPGLFAPCRRCSALAARQRYVTVRAATYTAEGLVETRAACEHCHTIDVTYAVMPRLRRPRRGRRLVAGGLVYAHVGGYDPMHAHGARHPRDAPLGSGAHHVHDEDSAYGDLPSGAVDSDAGELSHEACHADHDTSSYESGSSGSDSGFESSSCDDD